MVIVCLETVKNSGQTQAIGSISVVRSRGKKSNKGLKGLPVTDMEQILHAKRYCEG